MNLQACLPNALRANLRFGLEIGTQHCGELLDYGAVLGLVSEILVLLWVVLVVVQLVNIRRAGFPPFHESPPIRAHGNTLVATLGIPTTSGHLDGAEGIIE